MTNAEKLSRGIDRMRNQRTQVLSMISGSSQEQLDFKPSADVWSFGEIAHHIGLAERGMIRIAKDVMRSAGTGVSASKKVGYDELQMTPAGVPKSVFRLAPILKPFALTMRFMPATLHDFIIANRVVKVKTAPNLEPKAGMDRREIISFLNQMREETLQWLESVKDRDLSRYEWEHHLLGHHDIYGTLDVIADHEHRHLQQIEGVKKNPKFPASK
jgi:hypothetical protein